MDWILVRHKSMPSKLAARSFGYSFIGMEPFPVAPEDLDKLLGTGHFEKYEDAKKDAKPAETATGLGLRKANKPDMV